MKFVIEKYNGDMIESLEYLKKKIPGSTISSAKEKNGKLYVEVNQKYPTVPTRDFLLIKVEPNKTSYS